MSEEFDSILVYITNVNNVDRKLELNYLLNQYKDIVIASDVSLIERKNSNINENPLWIIIENNGKGIYLASKIYKKFQPWVSMGIVKNIYFHDFPEEIKEKEKWIPSLEKKLMKMKLSK